MRFTALPALVQNDVVYLVLWYGISQIGGVHWELCTVLSSIHCFVKQKAGQINQEDVLVSFTMA